MNEYVLEIKNLNKSYGKKQALTDVNLNLERGRIVGLLGPNGSGKTTMIKLINGLLTPNSGSITVDGNKIGKDSRIAVSYLPDKTYLPDWIKVNDGYAFKTEYQRKREAQNPFKGYKGEGTAYTGYEQKCQVISS